MAQTAAYELSGQNMRVNAICPGLIEVDPCSALFSDADIGTDGYDQSWPSSGQIGGQGEQIWSAEPADPAGSGCWYVICTSLNGSEGPSEVAQVALFLASSESDEADGEAEDV
jgi:NAD(P)-dependent dehydrogenase (short-subunit alcohol dehydrogenase family)